MMTIVLLLGTVAVTTAEPAIGKPIGAAALDHLARATKLYNVRSFEEAAAEYKAGALIEPAPVFDYNLGQCYRQLGRYKDAIWHYERFLRASPETVVHNASVATFISQMRAELESRAMTAPPTEPAAAVPLNAAPVAPAREHWYADRVGWALTASGVLALGGSVALLRRASELADDANHTASQRASDELHDRADVCTVVGTAMSVGGIALVATGVIKLAFTPDGITIGGSF